MIDLKKVREDIAGYKLICQKKGKYFDIDAILALDDSKSNSLLKRSMKAQKISKYRFKSWNLNIRR